MKVHNEEGTLLDPNDFGDGGYISAGLERGADYVFATKDGFSVPAEFSARFVMPGQDLEAEKEHRIGPPHSLRSFLRKPP